MVLKIMAIETNIAFLDFIIDHLLIRMIFDISIY